MNRKIIRLSLHEEAAQRLRERIYERHLKPGERIDEMALASELGISRTPLREALKVLQSEGLVTLVPRRGCFVSQLTDRDLDEIYETIALLESRGAAAAARNATPQDVQALRALHQRMERAANARNFEAYSTANRAVHEKIEDLAGNRWQKSIMQDLRSILKLSHGLTISLPGRLEQSMEEHRQLLEAIAKADAATAERVMHSHVMTQREAFRRIDAERERAGMSALSAGAGP